MASEHEGSQSLFLSRDTFVKQLKLERFVKLQDREIADEVYLLIRDFLLSSGPARNLQQNPPAGSLGYIIPGLPVSVNLKDFSKESITDLVLVYLLIHGVHVSPPEAVSAAVAKDVFKTLTLLDVRRGERCLIESIAEVEVTD